jgi:hypothetical protein
VAGGVRVAVAGEYLMGSGFIGVRLGEALGLDAPPVGVGLAGTAALLVAATAATRWLIRGMPVDVQHAGWWRRRAPRRPRRTNGRHPSGAPPLRSPP